jgi:hypothetical protein
LNNLKKLNKIPVLKKSPGGRGNHITKFLGDQKSVKKIRIPKKAIG